MRKKEKNEKVRGRKSEKIRDRGRHTQLGRERERDKE